jgi:hypothetical protein
MIAFVIEKMLWLGTLVGITNSLAAIPGFVGPYVVGAITNNNVWFCFLMNIDWMFDYSKQLKLGDWYLISQQVLVPLVVWLIAFYLMVKNNRGIESKMNTVHMNLLILEKKCCFSHLLYWSQ